MNLKKFGVINLLGLILFAADRILKYFFIKNPALNIGGDFFSLHFEKNYGLAFGLDFGRSLIVPAVALILFFLAGFLVSSLKRRDYFSAAAAGLIFIGAFSNLLDRLQLGYVVDYLDLSYFTVFNLADVLINMGVIGCVIVLWRRPQVDRQQNLP